MSKRYRRCIVSMVMAILGISRTSNAQKNSCFEAIVTKPSPMMGNNGEVLILSNSSVWEILYEYEYLYEYSPTVIACPSTGKIILNGKGLNARMLKAPSDTSALARLRDAEVIESRIDGDFEGWEGETVVKLANGQIWVQTDGKYKYKYKYKSSPRVLIVKIGNKYEMQVDGVDLRVKVERLR